MSKMQRFLRSLRVLRLLAVLLMVLGTDWALAQRNTLEETRPNLVLIITDDQVADLLPFMPQTQRELIRAGTRFTQAFATTPLCCPARSSVLRGQYAHNHSVLNIDDPQGGFPQFYLLKRERSTLATWLQDAGYTTALVGKYLNAYPYGPKGTTPAGFVPPPDSYVPPSWDQWFGFLDVPKDSALDPYKMYNFKVNENGRVVHYGHGPHDYQTDMLARRARETLETLSRNPNPFFLYLAPTSPHLPAVAAPRDIGTFPRALAPRPPSFNERDISDKPAWVRDIVRLSKHDLNDIDSTFRTEIEMVQSLDDLIGTVVSTLRERGELDNTYIVLTSDQGFHFGEHRLFRIKLTPYHASTHVPFVVRGPGVPAGAKRQELILNTDIAPTLADLGGARIPLFVDGRSLVPLLRGQTAPRWRQVSLVEFWPRIIPLLDDREESTLSVHVPKYKGLRSQKYLYTDYTYKDKRHERELYDLEKDPYELTNLIHRAPKPLLDALAARLEALKSCRAEGCRRLEDAPLP